MSVLRVSDEDLSMLPPHVRDQIAKATGKVHPIDARTAAAKARGAAAASKGRTDQAPLWLRALSTIGEVREMPYTPNVWTTPLGDCWGQWRFAAPREWAADFAYPQARVLIEIDGGQYKHGGGRHGSDGDRMKLNEASAAGFAVLRFSPRQLRKTPAECVDVVRRAIEWRA